MVKQCEIVESFDFLIWVVSFLTKKKSLASQGPGFFRLNFRQVPGFLGTTFEVKMAHPRLLWIEVTPRGCVHYLFGHLRIKCFFFQCNRVRYDYWRNFNKRNLSYVPHKNQFVNNFPVDYQCLCFNDIASLKYWNSTSNTANGIFLSSPAGYNTLHMVFAKSVADSKRKAWMEIYLQRNFAWAKSFYPFTSGHLSHSIYLRILKLVYLSVIFQPTLRDLHWQNLQADLSPNLHEFFPIFRLFQATAKLTSTALL